MITQPKLRKKHVMFPALSGRREGFAPHGHDLQGCGVCQGYGTPEDNLPVEQIHRIIEREVIPMIDQVILPINDSLGDIYHHASEIVNYLNAKAMYVGTDTNAAVVNWFSTPIQDENELPLGQLGDTFAKIVHSTLTSVQFPRDNYGIGLLATAFIAEKSTNTTTTQKYGLFSDILAVAQNTAGAVAGVGHPAECWVRIDATTAQGGRAGVIALIDEDEQDNTRWAQLFAQTMNDIKLIGRGNTTTAPLFHAEAQTSSSSVFLALTNTTLGTKPEFNLKASEGASYARVFGETAGGFPIAYLEASGGSTAQVALYDGGAGSRYFKATVGAEYMELDQDGLFQVVTTLGGNTQLMDVSIAGAAPISVADSKAHFLNSVGHTLTSVTIGGDNWWSYMLGSTSLGPKVDAGCDITITGTGTTSNPLVIAHTDMGALAFTWDEHELGRCVTMVESYWDCAGHVDYVEGYYAVHRLSLQNRAGVGASPGTVWGDLILLKAGAMLLWTHSVAGIHGGGWIEHADIGLNPAGGGAGMHLSNMETEATCNHIDNVTWTDDIWLHTGGTIQPNTTLSIGTTDLDNANLRLSSDKHIYMDGNTQSVGLHYDSANAVMAFTGANLSIPADKKLFLDGAGGTAYFTYSTATSILSVSIGGTTVMTWGSIVTYVNASFQDQVTITGATADLLSLVPGFTGSGAVVVVTPSAAINTQDAEWDGFKIDAAALDPSVAGVDIHGFHADFSGIDETNLPHLDGVRVVLPVAGADLPDNHAIHLIEGQFYHYFTSGTAAAGHYDVQNTLIDARSQNANAKTHALGVRTLGTPAGTVCALAVGGNVCVIDHDVTTWTTPDQAGVDAEALRVTAGPVYTTGIDGNEIFVTNSDEIWLCYDGAAWEALEVIMTTPAARGVNPTFWYYNNGAAWVQFFPSDGTDGFEQSGYIEWDSAGFVNWDATGDPADGSGEEGYWIRIVRTRNADPGTPTPLTIKTATAVTNYNWAATGDVSVRAIACTAVTSTGAVTGTNLNVANWDTAFGWGDHAGLYLLNSLIDAAGDIVYGSADNTFARLAKGANGEVLTLAGGLPTWAAAAGGGDVTAAAIIADHTIVRGDGGAKGIQDSGITISDADNVSGMGTLGCGAVTSTGAVTGTNLNVANWDTAFGWGDHAGLYEVVGDRGIADDNLVEIDSADVADDDYAKFTANGLEGRSYTEVLADLSGQAGAAFAWSGQNLTGVGTIGCGAITSTGNLILPDAGYIGSASDTDAIQIEADGDVVLTQKLGIGVTPEAWTAYSVLRVGPEGSLVSSASNTLLSHNFYYDGASRYITADEATQLYLTAQGAINFRVSNEIGAAPGDVIPWLTAMSISNAGNVGIGVEATVSRLRADAAENVTYAIEGRAYRTAGTVYSGFFKTDGDNVEARGIAIQCGEDTEVGTNYWLRARDGNGTTTGWLWSIAGVFALADISDSSLKTVHGEWEGCALDRIRALNVKDWEFKKNPGHVLHNFIANDVAAVIPEAASYDEEAELWAYSRDLLVPTLWKGAQEADAERAAMQIRINELEAEMAVLKGN